MTVLPGEAPVPQDWRDYEDDEFLDLDEEDEL